jgi:hypothetical protein
MQPIAYRTRTNRDNANSIAASANAALRVTFSLPADHIDKSTLSRDPNRTRVTIGGNTINYIGDCGTKTSSLETVKLVINSTLSTPNAEYMTMDLSNFYLGTPLDRPEYVRIKLSVIPQEVIDAYGLEKYTYNL